MGIRLKWFIYEFLCTWNIGKRIFFIILKFIIRSSNMDVHTCRCIWFITWVVWIKIQNGLHCFWKEIKNGFEVKEKKEKENWKIKEFKKGCKIYFWKRTKIAHFYWNWKVYLKLYLNLIWIIFDFDWKSKIGKWKILPLF